MQILLSHLARAWLRLLIMVLAVLLLTLPSITTAGRNVILDAVTRATTWNTYTGDLELLQDGEVPGEGVQPRALLWEGGGILVFEWDEPLALEKVRIYIGEIGNNAVHPDWRQKGIAQQLYAAALQHFRDQGMRFARVQTGMDGAHAPARRAYERAGFDIHHEDITYHMKL